MSYSTACNAAEAGALKGTGRTGKAQVGADQEVFWSPSDFAFASKEDAVDIAAWNTAVAAGNLYYFGTIEEFDANDVEPTFYESPNGNLRLKTAEAKRVRQYRFVECSCTHAALRSFDGVTGRLFFRTLDGFLRARYNSDGTVQGFLTSQFDVGLLTSPTTETPAFTPVDVTFAAPDTDDENQFEDKIDFRLEDVDQIFNAELAASAVTSGASLDFTLAITKDCSNVPLTGVTESNLVVKDVNGNTLVKTVTPNGDVYDVSVTTALTACIVDFDGVQVIGGTPYTSEDLSVSV